MSGVSKAQIEQAKRVDMLTYLQTYEPDNITKTSPNEYRLKDHDSFTISNNQWHWWNRGKVSGKTALDFLIKVRGIDFVSAVRHLCNQRAPPDFSSQRVNKFSEAESKFVKTEFITSNPPIKSRICSAGAELEQQPDYRLPSRSRYRQRDNRRVH